MSFEKRLSSALHPWLALRLRAIRALRAGEPELRLLDVLCEKGKASVDVGANKGIYTFFCRRYGGRVYAVEALPELAKQLRRSFHRGVEVLQIALSDERGTSTLRVPLVSGREIDTRGSLEAAATEGGAFVEVKVETSRLDDLNMRNVGFLKIDVEGHELNVLRGASEFLQREQPTALVEAEERHRPGCTQAVFDLFAAAGYSGWFADGNELRPVSDFVPNTHQNPNHVKPAFGKRSGIYRNNFIFIPPRRSSSIELIRQRVQSW